MAELIDNSLCAAQLMNQIYKHQAVALKLLTAAAESWNEMNWVHIRLYACTRSITVTRQPINDSLLRCAATQLRRPWPGSTYTTGCCASSYFPRCASTPGPTSLLKFKLILQRAVSNGLPELCSRCRRQNSERCGR